MDSMTQKEKDEPLLLKSSRIRRIARGSGATEKDVKELLAQWNRSRKMKRRRKWKKQMKMKRKIKRKRKQINMDNITVSSLD